MSIARLIVCEKTGRWARLFRRALPAGQLVSEARGLAPCGRLLAEAPASLVAVEATEANLEALIDSLCDWTRDYPAARFIALINAGDAPFEPLLREAGALDVLSSAGGVPAAARLVRRHLSRAPREELSWRDAIFARLPWAAWATRSA
jgi:hypothetical protein